MCNMPVVDANPDPSKMVFDKEVMAQLLELKLDVSQVSDSLRQGVHNHLTASYYLQLNRKMRNQDKQMLRDKMNEEHENKQKTVEELTLVHLDSLNKSKANKTVGDFSDPSTAGAVGGSLPLPTPGSGGGGGVPSEGSNSIPPNNTAIPKLPLSAIRNPLSSNFPGAANEQLPDLVTKSQVAPPKGSGGSNARAQARAQGGPTGSQSARHPDGGGGLPPQMPPNNGPATARPAPAPLEALEDGGTIASPSPWADASGDRPSTRSGTRGESRSAAKLRVIADGLGIVEKPSEAPSDVSEAAAAGSGGGDDGGGRKPVAPAAPPGARPANSTRGGSGRRVIDPSAPSAAQPSANITRGGSGRRVIDPSAPSAAQPSQAAAGGGGGAGGGGREGGGGVALALAISPVKVAKIGAPEPGLPELSSEPSSRTAKSLYNDLVKACKSRSVGLKQQAGMSFLCETSLGSDKDPVIFSLQVEKFGEVQGMHVLKGRLVGGSESDMKKVCKVIFNAVNNKK